MGQTDKRNKLDQQLFSYQVSKDNRTFIFYDNKRIKVLKGKESEKFLARIDKVDSINERQLIMAKVTGNFKRGNE